MIKEYTISDLFKTEWRELGPRAHAEVFALRQNIQHLQPGSPEYGFHLIYILKRLIKNPRLVDRINETQAVDIYNDLKFLDEPWYYFPVMPTHYLEKCPEEMMAKHSFDQFIYADNEFSNFAVHQDEKFLRRLAVTLYRPKGEIHFDKETVEENADKIKGHLKEWQLNIIFFTYAQIRAMVQKRCKTLLAPAVGESKPTNTGPMWNEIKHQAARTHVFGTFDELGCANMYDVLDHLELLSKEKRDAKR